MKNGVQTNSVTAREETVVIPTYPPAAPDPNPMFPEGRVNQGTSGRLYPNPLTDRITDEKTDRPYRAVFLENEYIRLMILPEIGGRVHAGLDKTNDYEFIYHQHVIKPVLVGLFGPWISGGMEFNWPQHHRPSTFDPVDYLIEEHADGSRTVWLSEHEPMGRTKGMVGICLHPGKAFVETKVQLYNRTALPQSFLWWVNAAVHANDQCQVFFPPDVNMVTDHSKRAMSHWPVARDFYYGVDYTKGVDLSWYKNIRASSSYFVIETHYDFLGSYDHGRRAGLIHVADRHISPGKKMFTWGNTEFGLGWQRNLTDDDGPYFELMAGVYTDNQPDFSWLQPYESRTFSQWWYPFKKIGPVKNANRHAAVNLEADGRRVKLGVCTTEVFRGASVALTAGNKVLFQRKLDLLPAAPLVEEVELAEGHGADGLLLRVCGQDGGELIRYSPEKPQEKSLPQAAAPPGPPEEIATTEELYITGLHLEQYHHPDLAGESYWQEALRRDPTDARNNNAMGLLRLRRGEFAKAEDHFRKAIETLTRRNPNPYDGEPFYNLGLALKYQDRFDEAYAAFHKAVWSYAWSAAGYYALAEIDCRRGDFAAALDHLDRSLVTNTLNLKARNLKVAALRRSGRSEQAETLARETITIDPLDFWSRNEMVLLSRAGADAQEARDRLEELSHLMRGQVQTYLDIAFDYAGAGLWDEAGELLRRLVDEKDKAAPVHPMVLYSLGHFAARQGAGDEARAFFRSASEMPPDYCFPVRLEEMRILFEAQAANPDDARASYYLGNLLYDKQRYEEAIRNWETSCRLEPGFSIPWRNLGIAYYNVRKDPDKARTCYLKAFESNPRDPRLLFESDQLLKRLGTAPAERLARLERHQDLAKQRDDCSLELAALYNRTDQPQEALKVLLSRRFHPWEGGTGMVSGQYVGANVLLGRAALEAGNAAEALAYLEAAQEYPDNIGERKNPLTLDAHIHYFAGLAKEALGDSEGAEARFRQASKAQSGFSFTTYYQALALMKLGEEAAGVDRLNELLEFATQRRQTGSRSGFSTSVPKFTLFKDDPQRLNRIECTYLIALAQLGLGQVSPARKAFEEVLALDISHLEAYQELRRLPASP